ncbi:maleylpyruvate isomerase family mycothiol-dependent enzyme [Streptomyces sp. AK02-04a]|uniref:maleylpyruvate isomerase family mycothiol-dependent enzyme n=1 Tax=Streptomyces sp. AK02-04a TaxID=3028649 RepID=UPI0029AE5797|nr:maleylpyruvate isomerase family mycothiol-dependent enzyme [Streptomyces sp. AK02-04a]MDX3762547.1 maleylpyruvate isomerase family mycothiol-dependent enzyme [Streptomyces sp. AK02-04a]
MESVAGPDVRGAVPEGLGAAIRDTAEEIAALLRAGAGMERRVPQSQSQWSVGEAAAHLALANELMADVAAGRARSYGDGTAQSLAAANEQALAAFGERGAEPLAGMIVEQAGACLRALEERSAQGTVVTPLGPMGPDVLGSYLLTHMLGHGYDLARALGRAHMIDRERVRLTLPFFLTVMPRVTDTAGTAGLSARYAIRLWGGGRFGVRVAGGTVSVGERLPGRADCTILIEPVTFLLMALGRRGQWGALAQGRILVGGRKPWLAPRFPALFKAP